MENAALFMRPMLATYREAGEEVWDLVSSSWDDYLLLCAKASRGQEPRGVLGAEQGRLVRSVGGTEAEDQAREDIGT